MNSNKQKYKNDIILIATILIISSALLIYSNINREDGSYVSIKIDGQQVGVYSLSKNGKYELNKGANILIIENGYAYMFDANCPDKICIKEGKISKVGQCITCLPNKIIVEVKNDLEDFELYSG